VFVAVEKSETAFKTLLAIRSKLLDAYDEIQNMPI
ncbi:MAG: flagellar hook-basal body complex protein FliE, partial [Tepidisphaeraceae bacterium]